MWLLLGLKSEMLLGVYSSKKAAEDSIKLLNKVDKKKVQAEQIIVHYIDVEVFHHMISPLFDSIKGVNKGV